MVYDVVPWSSQAGEPFYKTEEEFNRTLTSLRNQFPSPGAGKSKERNNKPRSRHTAPRRWERLRRDHPRRRGREPYDVRETRTSRPRSPGEISPGEISPACPRAAAADLQVSPSIGENHFTIGRG